MPNYLYIYIQVNKRYLQEKLERLEEGILDNLGRQVRKKSQVRVSYLYFMDLKVIKIIKRCKSQFKQVCIKKISGTCILWPLLEGGSCALRIPKPQIFVSSFPQNIDNLCLISISNAICELFFVKASISINYGHGQHDNMCDFGQDITF